MAETRHCSRCGQDKEEAAFAPSIWKRKGAGVWCRMCHRAYYRERQEDGQPRQSKYQRRFRHKATGWLWELRAERGCERCGEKHPAVLDFHHRDEKEKEFRIANMVLRASRERVEAEVAKCIILCANCHRKLHYEEKSGQFGRSKKDS